MSDPASRGRKEPKVSVPANFMFASLSGFLNIFVPVLTYPYIARVLGPEKMGSLGVAGALCNYFIVAAAMGLPVYGVRLIAQSRNDRAALSKNVGELLRIALCASLAATAMYAALIATVPAYRSNLSLFIIFGLTIPASALNVEWLYQGLERFRYIGLRNLGVKLAFIASLFLLVRKSGDYLVYAALFSVAAIANAAMNLASAGKIASPEFRGVSPARHLRPMATFSVLQFAMTAFANIDLLMLGFLADGRQTGYYAVSIRLVRMLIALATTLSTVLFPRLSALADSDPGSFRRTLKTSSALSLLLSLPAGFGLWACADDLSIAFAGQGFSNMASSLKIAAFMIPAAAASNFLQMQLLVPKKKERATIFSYAAGTATTAFIMVFAVPNYGHAGAAAAMLAGELVVLGINASLCGWKKLVKVADAKAIVTYLTGAVICALASLSPRLWMSSGFARLTVSVLFGAMAYALVLALARDSYALRVLGVRLKTARAKAAMR